MVAEAGFDLKLRVTEAATAQKQAEDGDYQLYMNNWSGRIDPDGNTVIYQTCSGPMNMGKYCDKEVDALHEQARTASDLAARNAAYEKLAGQVPAERLDHLPLPPAVSDRVHRPGRGLQADAGRAAAGGRREAEVALLLPSPQRGKE